MSFVYFVRKPEDVKNFKEFQLKKKELSEEYNKKRSDYDKSLEKYCCLLKKLDVLQKDSIEHKALIVDLETLSTQLKEEKPKNVPDIIISDTEEKTKTKRKVPVKKQIVLDSE